MRENSCKSSTGMLLLHPSRVLEEVDSPERTHEYFCQTLVVTSEYQVGPSGWLTISSSSLLGVSRS